MGSLPRIGVHSDEWGILIPFRETVSFFPTSEEYRYRFQIRYQNSPPVGKKDTVFQNGIDIPHQTQLVGKKGTVSQYGIDTPHQWGKKILFLKTVSKFPTKVR